MRAKDRTTIDRHLCQPVPTSPRRINSRSKGKRGERDAAHYLTALGFPARRGQQHRGGNDSPDVVCDALAGVHLEVKHRGGIDVHTQDLADAIEQAERDATGTGGTACRTGVVLWKRNRTCWRLSWREGGIVLTTTGDDAIKAVLVKLNSGGFIHHYTRARFSDQHAGAREGSGGEPNSLCGITAGISGKQGFLRSTREEITGGASLQNNVTSTEAHHAR